MNEHERRRAAYADQVRAKYDTAQLKALKAAGHTLPGTTSYPIDDQDDLEKAIKAVGRGNADHDTIRKYIIGRAKDMGLSDLIPDDWNADGSIKRSNSPDGEPRNAPASTPNEARALLGLAAEQYAGRYFSQGMHPTGIVSLEKVDSPIDKALVAQSKDGHEDQPSRSKNWATPKMAQRAFSSLAEWPAACEQKIEVRMSTDPDSPIAHFHGYPSTTDVWYDVHDWLGKYEERMAPGSFGKTLREQENVPLLFDHSGLPLASTGSGTSSLAEDKRGLRNDADLDRRDAFSNSVCVQLDRGVLNKMSLSFRSVKEDWNDEYDQRTVTECALYDTSIVTYPANPTTTAELRESMRAALGREGRSLWLSDSEMSIRSALGSFRDTPLDDDRADLLERALRAIAHADEVMFRSQPSGRARTFLVARALGELRAGRVLSAANHDLLRKASDALADADTHRQALTDAHSTAAAAVQAVIDAASNDPTGPDGSGNGTPPATGDPMEPDDGAGARSLPLSVIQARARVERLKHPRR